MCGVVPQILARGPLRAPVASPKPTVWPLDHQSGRVPAPRHPMTKGACLPPWNPSLYPKGQPCAVWMPASVSPLDHDHGRLRFSPRPHRRRGVPAPSIQASPEGNVIAAGPPGRSLFLEPRAAHMSDCGSIGEAALTPVAARRLAASRRNARLRVQRSAPISRATASMLLHPRPCPRSTTISPRQVANGRAKDQRQLDQHTFAGFPKSTFRRQRHVLPGQRLCAAVGISQAMIRPHHKTSNLGTSKPRNFLLLRFRPQACARLRR